MLKGLTKTQKLEYIEDNSEDVFNEIQALRQELLLGRLLFKRQSKKLNALLHFFRRKV